MIIEFIKLFAPALILGAWVIFALRVKSPSLIGVGLFFASYVGFSQNFSFVYRELHQGIQILLTAVFILYSIRTGRILRVNVIFGVFLFFIGISLIFAPMDEDAKSQLLNYLVAVCVANYLFVSLRTIKDLDKVMRFVAGLSVLLALFGFVEFLFNAAGRAEATFSNPNYYGLFLGVGFCVVFASWRGWRRNFALVLIVLAIFMSESRSAIVFPVLQFLWIIYREGRFLKFLPIAMTLLLAATFIFYSGSSRYADTDQKEASDAERIIFAGIALRIANDHPLTGVGWGRFISEFGNYSSSAEQVFIASGGVIDASKQDRRVTHNDFLRILAELGLIVFTMAIAFVIYGAKVIVKKRGFGLDYMPPIWFGLLLFSMGHNNMNGAFFWFFLLLPFYINSRDFRGGVAEQSAVKVGVL